MRVWMTNKAGVTNEVPLTSKSVTVDGVDGKDLFIEVVLPNGDVQRYSDMESIVVEGEVDGEGSE